MSDEAFSGTARKVAETKWTPGPWTVEDPLSDTFMIVPAGVPTSHWVSIALIPRDDEPDDFGPVIDATHQIANAHLIAAAPDLYEALERAIELVERGHRCIERQEWE